MLIVYLLVIVLAGVTAFSLICNLLYWYENLNAAERWPELPIPLPRPGIVSCGGALLRSLYGYLICVLLFPVGFLTRRAPAPPAPGDDPALPPVILIHGLFNNASDWVYFGFALRRAGYRISTYSYRSLFVSVDRIIQGLEEHIRRVEAFGGARPVLIGHSLGGVLSRTWLMREENQRRIGGLITLGTPHGGSKLAVLAPGALAAQITPRGGLIVALQAAPYPGNVPCVSLVSPTDELVMPASGLVPPLPPQGRWRLRVTRPVGHHSMLFFPSVAEMALDELRALSTPPSA